MIRRPPRSTPLYSSAASDVYKRQVQINNLDRLVTWSNEFLGRRDNDRVYPAPIIRGEPNIRSSSSTVDVNVTEENEKRQ